MPPLRPKRISVRPEDQPIHTSPSSMDFEKRRMVVASVSPSMVGAMMPTVSSALVFYDGVAVSHDGDAVYKL